MVGLESEHEKLAVGSDVEVTSDEEGFKGAWYGAVILEPFPKSFSKKKKKALVQYKSLVTEDGKEFLKERVDPVHIRPMPPPDPDRKFEVNDAIDAFYQDGWWAGMILKELDSSKYLIFFDNPPDIIESESSNLRKRLEWVDGKWVPSEKQKETTGSIFAPGTEVEVHLQKDSSGAWFPATFIKEIEKDIYSVKFLKSENDIKNMFPSEPVSPKLTVDSQHIRPTPPLHVDRSYELLEKVEAFYDFAWRVGLITKVLAEGRYLVFFKHANKAIELGQSEVRPLVKWIDGKWIADKKEVLVASDCQVQLGLDCNNTDIPEVDFQHERSAYATDCIEEKKNCTTNSGKDSMELPTPCNESSLSEAFTPTAKKLKLVASNGDATLSQSSKKLIRKAADPPLSVTSTTPRRVVIKTSSKPAACKSAPLGRGGRVGRSAKRPFAGSQVSAKTKSPREKHIRIKQMGELINETSDIGIRRGGRPKKPSVKYPRILAAGKEENGGNVVAEKVGTKKDGGTAVVVALESTVRRGSDNENIGQLSNAKSLKPVEDENMLLNSPEVSKRTEIKQPKSVGSSRSRKRGRPRKLLLNSKGNNNYGVGDLTGGMVGKECTTYEDSRDAVRQKVGDVAQTNCSTKEVDAANSGTTKTVVDDDQPLSTWFGGIQSLASVDESRLCPGRAVNQRVEGTEMPIESPVINSGSNSVNGENQGLPFVKSSPVWNTIESMEVFRMMPQTPHFRPLGDCKEEYREGSAIGNMITFANVVEKTSKLQFDDPRSAFDSILETTHHLEEHGFEVKPLQTRVKELLSIKDGQQQLLDESKDVKSKLLQHTDERAKYEDEIDEIAKKISALQEIHALIKSKHHIVGDEITRLHTVADTISKTTQKAQTEFEKVAAAPWKLT